jgi:hypothetical protein
LGLLAWFAEWDVLGAGDGEPLGSRDGRARPVVSPLLAAGSAVVGSWATIVAPRAPVIRARTTIVAPRAAVVSPRAAVAVEAAATSVEAAAGITLAVPFAGRGWRQRPGGRRFALGGRAAELGARGGKDPGRLGTHAEDPPAARGQDLEIEVVEPDAERLTGLAKGILDGLAGELAVCTGRHRRLPRRPCRPRWRIVAFAEVVRSRVDRSVLGRPFVAAGRADDCGAAGAATGKRG